MQIIQKLDLQDMYPSTSAGRVASPQSDALARKALVDQYRRISQAFWDYCGRYRDYLPLSTIEELLHQIPDPLDKELMWRVIDCAGYPFKHPEAIQTIIKFCLARDPEFFLNTPAGHLDLMEIALKSLSGHDNSSRYLGHPLREESEIWWHIMAVIQLLPYKKQSPTCQESYRQMLQKILLYYHYDNDQDTYYKPPHSDWMQKTIKLFLQSGVPVESEFPSGLLRNIIYREDDVDFVILLVRAGAALTIEKDKYTTMGLAIHLEKWDCVAGIAREIPFVRSVEQADYLRALQYTIAHPQDNDHQNNQSYSFRHITQHEKIQRLAARPALLASGIPADAILPNGEPALLFAVKNDIAVQEFLSSGRDSTTESKLQALITESKLQALIMQYAKMALARNDVRAFEKLFKQLNPQMLSIPQTEKSLMAVAAEFKRFACGMIILQAYPYSSLQSSAVRDAYLCMLNCALTTNSETNCAEGFEIAIALLRQLPTVPPAVLSQLLTAYTPEKTIDLAPSSLPVFIADIMRKGADLTCRNANGDTPMVTCAKKQHWDWIIQIAQLQSAQDSGDAEGYAQAGILTMIQSTPENAPRVIAVITALLDAGCDLQRPHPLLHQQTVLHLVVEKNLHELIPVLLNHAHGLHLMLPNAAGESAILYAAHCSQWDSVTVLAQQRPAPNKDEEVGYHAALLLAVLAGNYKSIWALRQTQLSGIDGLVFSETGNTIFHQVVHHNPDHFHVDELTRMSQWVVEQPNVLTMRNTKGLTVLHCAVELQHWLWVSTILQQRFQSADQNPQTKNLTAEELQIFSEVLLASMRHHLQQNKLLQPEIHRVTAHSAGARNISGVQTSVASVTTHYFHNFIALIQKYPFVKYVVYQETSTLSHLLTEALATDHFVLLETLLQPDINANYCATPTAQVLYAQNLQLALMTAHSKAWIQGDFRALALIIRILMQAMLPCETDSSAATTFAQGVMQAFFMQLPCLLQMSDPLKKNDLLPQQMVQQWIHGLHEAYSIHSVYSCSQAELEEAQQFLEEIYEKYIHALLTRREQAHTRTSHTSQTQQKIVLRHLLARRFQRIRTSPMAYDVNFSAPINLFCYLLAVWIDPTHYNSILMPTCPPEREDACYQKFNEMPFGQFILSENGADFYALRQLFEIFRSRVLEGAVQPQIDKHKHPSTDRKYLLDKKDYFVCAKLDPGSESTRSLLPLTITELQRLARVIPQLIPLIVLSEELLQGQNAFGALQNLCAGLRTGGAYGRKQDLVADAEEQKLQESYNNALGWAKEAQSGIEDQAGWAAAAAFLKFDAWYDHLTTEQQQRLLSLDGSPTGYSMATIIKRNGVYCVEQLSKAIADYLNNFHAELEEICTNSTSPKFATKFNALIDTILQGLLDKGCQFYAPVPIGDGDKSHIKKLPKEWLPQMWFISRKRITRQEDKWLAWQTSYSAVTPSG